MQQPRRLRTASSIFVNVFIQDDAISPTPRCPDVIKAVPVQADPCLGLHLPHNTLALTTNRLSSL